MGRRAAVALYVLAMVGVVVGVDVLFLRMLFWERLIVNVGIVLVFVVVYFRFLKRPLAARDVRLHSGSPDRIRTGVTALRGRRPRPLDDGAEHGTAGSCRAGMLAAPAAYRLPPHRRSGQPTAKSQRSGAWRLGMNKRGHRIVSALATPLAGVPGLEPRLTGPEPAGLPITPYPNGIALLKPGALTQFSGPGLRQPTPSRHSGSMAVRPASRSRRSQRVIPAERRNGAS